MIRKNEKLIPGSSAANDVRDEEQFTDSKNLADGDKRARMKAGRKRSDNWHNWIAEVVIFAQSGEIDLQDSAEAFYDQINERLIERKVEAPEWTTVEKAISAIRNRWREAAANQELSQ